MEVINVPEKALQFLRATDPKGCYNGVTVYIGFSGYHTYSRAFLERCEASKSHTQTEKN